jgi:hypothetical protein
MSKLLQLFLLALVITSSAKAGELASVNVPDEISLSNGDTLQLNGMGLREKLWIDVYVGSLYLPKPARTVADALAQPGGFRIQMDFLYNEVSSSKLIDAWTDGFEKNQSEEALKVLESRMQSFYQLFEESAKKGDNYIIEYVPGEGSKVSKNGVTLGLIQGEDFKTALIEIWLGNHPADQGLKEGMLGRE